MNRRNLIVLGKALLLFVVAIALQTLIVSQVSVLGVTADLFLILTIVIAIGRGSLTGPLFGFAAGLMADIAFMQPLGVRALVYVIAGYFVGMVVVRFGSVGPWAVFLVAIGASFSAQLVFGIFQFILGPRAGFFTMLGIQMLPEAILDGLMAVPIFVLLGTSWDRPRAAKAAGRAKGGVGMILQPAKKKRMPEDDSFVGIRVGVLLLLAFVVLGILVFRLWYLQILSGDDFVGFGDRQPDAHSHGGGSAGHYLRPQR